ncbi:MAG: ABC transporter ATP-binding protein [Bacteroidales bacterium]|nr:ABC transporter ATP-binding protein [Bacteroidales bacterium]
MYLRFIKYLKPYWKKEVLILFLMALGSIASLASPYILKIIIDKVFPSKDFHLLVKVLLILFSINIARILVSFCSDYLFEWVSNHIMLDIRKDLFSHMIRLPMSFFDKNKTGDMIHRINSEVNTIQSLLTGSMLRFINGILMIVGLGVALCLLNYKLFLISLITIPFIFINTLYFQSKIRRLIKKSREKDADILAYLIERLENVKLIKIYTKYVHENNKLTGKINEWIHFNLRNVVLSSTTKGFSTLLISFTPILIFYWGGGLVIKDALTIGSLVAFIQYLNRLYDPLRDMMSLYIDIVRSSVSMRRIYEFFELSQELSETDSSNDLIIHKSIEFKDVSFSYDSNLVLNKLSLEFKAGKVYAIVGTSGCGKSTIINLLCRFYEKESGQIFIDGQELEHIGINSLRKKIALITQDNQLFHDTIWENIKYGNETAPKDEITKSAKVTGIYDHIMTIDDKFDSVVGDKGTKLSGGQKQRIAIARALLKKSDVVILDEATSALDSESEKQIFNNLRDIYKDKTMILVSHRLSAIKEVDEIICMDKGQVVEQGSHEALINTKGFYYSLFKNQIE